MAATRSNPNKFFSTFSFREKDKIGSILSLIAQKTNGIYLTRMMKHLYIIDEESIKEIGVPVLPFEYKVAEKGPLIMELWNVFKYDSPDFSSYIESYRDKDSILIKSIAEPNLNRFSEYELELIDKVIEKHINDRTEDMIDYLHSNGSLWDKSVRENNIDFTNKKVSDHSIDFKELVKDNETNKEFFELYYSTRG